MEQGANRQKGRRAGRPPGSQSQTLTETPMALSFTFLHTCFPHLCLSFLPSFLSSLPLPISFISLCPSFSLCLSFCYPSEAGGLARGWHSQAELGWEIAFTVGLHAKLHTKSNDWCSWKCLLQGKASCIVFGCQMEYSWRLAMCMSEKNLAMRPGCVSACAIVLIDHF